MRKRLAFSLVFSCLAAMPYAHSQISTGTGSLNSSQGQSTGSSDDCSDPANALSGSCSSQLNQQLGLGNFGQAGQTGERNVPTGAPLSNRFSTFNDLGTPASVNNNPNLQQLPTPVPPEQLTEFQKFIAGTTGEVLPIFGASLFSNVPSTFAPVEQVPVTPDYILGPDDVLRIRIWGQVNFNANVRVDRSGSIYLPQVGSIHVSGLPFSALEQHLRTEIGRVYRNFDLTVDAGQLRSIQVFVVGQARRPGSYTVSSLSTLVNALFASGGPSTQGSLRHIQLKRQGKTITDFDLYDLLVNGDKSKDVQLLPGDVIFIPPVGPQVALTGSVHRPAIYELRDENTTIQELLAIGGGASTVASDSRISIERTDGHQAREAMEVAFNQAGLTTTLRDGDLLRVLSIAPRYKKTVTLRGNTANPGHFAWHEGMRLSELIPDRESLLTRDYYWRRAQLGLPTPEFQPYVAGPVKFQPTSPVDLQSIQAFQQWQLQNSLQQLPNGQYVSKRPQTQPDDFRNYLENQYPYGEGSVYLRGNPPTLPRILNSNGSGSNNNGNDTSSASQASMSNPFDLTGQLTPDQQQQTNGAASEGSSGSLARRQQQLITENTISAASRTDVKLSAPEINWDYAVIQRIDPVTLKNSLIPFQLGKLVLDHDPTQDLVLQPGDVVTIFSQADFTVPQDRQTKFVRLEGEFARAGIYSVQPGETLRQLVSRAGGFTPDAYLYGSSFTRQSTRVIQQQRIDEYVQSLELNTQRSAVASANSSVSPQDVASTTAAITSSRDLLNRLHQIRATGRIVLQIAPNSTGVDSLPDIQLEDGDTFTVPPVPATVNVVGSVYDQNSFLFTRDRRMGEYLKLAGGPNNNADKKHIFVIRADGSVVSKTTNSGLWGNTFEALRINPGDTIVVPEKTFKPTVLRGVLDWSQLFSQLALGAAAISVI